MNHYTMADMTPGRTEEFTVTVTAEMMDAFCALTGDTSPIHIDEGYARAVSYTHLDVYKRQHKNRASPPAHGGETLCLCSLYSAVDVASVAVCAPSAACCASAA